jgi:hypothetical protein
MGGEDKMIDQSQPSNLNADSDPMPTVAILQQSPAVSDTPILDSARTQKQDDIHVDQGFDETSRAQHVVSDFTQRDNVVINYQTNLDSAPV